MPMFLFFASASHAILLGVTPDRLGDQNIIATVNQAGATPLAFPI